MIKKEVYLLLALIFLMLIIPLTSAGFVDWFKATITGKAPSATTSLNITIGNAAPVINWVEAIPPLNPVESGTNSTTFNFTATDTDGVTNINGDTGEVRFQKAGETTRLNTSCINWSSSGNDMNFTCNVTMWYYDAADSDWMVNVTVRDINDATGRNSSTSLTHILLTSMIMSPTSLGWTGVGISSTDTGSNTDPILINNTGNDVNLNINVTGIDLRGEETPGEYIYAVNFTIENKTEGCTGTAMINATSINVTSAILQNGNNSLSYDNSTSGQEQIYFCLQGVPQDISPQSYSSASLGAWTVKIVTT